MKKITLSFYIKVEYTKHYLQVKNRLENPLTSPNDNSPEKLKYSLISIDPSKPIDNRQENLIRRCLSMMLPPPPIISKLTVPDIEVMNFFVRNSRVFFGFIGHR